MTLKYAQGFETMRDDTDLRAQGWVNGPVSRSCGFVPSANGSGTGYAMALMGANRVGTSGYAGGSGVTDPAYFNLGVTINSLWNAGGFTLGASGKLNAGAANAPGAGSSNQLAFDGTKYWTILRNLTTSSANVATSTDLINWTVTPAQPSNAGVYAGLAVLGSGLVAVIGIDSSTSVQYYYSTNSGATWNQKVLYTTASTAGAVTGHVINTGNSSFPHALIISSNSSGATGTNNGVWIGDITGTMTNVTGAGAGNIYFCPWRITNGYLNVIGNGFVYSALANNVALNTAGAWSKSTTTLTGGASDFVFFPAGNLWVASTQSGISTTPNTGTVGAPIPPTGSFTWTSRYSTLAVYRLAVDGSNIYAFCANGTVVTSTDGLTWTVTAQQHMMPAVSASNYWTNCIYDGTRWVMSSSGPYGLVATAPTLAYGWQLVSTAEAAEANPGPYSALSVLSYTGTFGSTFTMPIVQGFGIVVGSISAGNRPVTLYGWTNATTNVAAVTGSIPSAPNAWHSYELKAVKDTTVNTFKLSLYIDGVLIGTSAAAYAIGAGTSDTTSQAFINVQASGQITQYDDMYFTIDNGTGVVGPLGVINIMAIRPSGDVQAQWTKAGSAGTNAASARVDGLSQANPANYVTTNTDGAQDQYSLDDIPTTYKVAAVMSEAYFAKIGTSAPTTSVGVVSGAVEADSTQVAIASTNFTYMSSIVEKDPNGNVAWTPSTVNALKLAINKVS